MKKLVLSLLMVSILTGTAAMPVSAAETRAMPNDVVEVRTDMLVSGADMNGEPISYGKPISESVYTDDDGTEVTEKIYFVPAKKTNWTSNDIRIFDLNKSSLSGEGWYKKEKVQKWLAGETRYWVKGYFVWGNGKSELKHPKYHYTNTGKGVKIKDIDKKKTTNSLKLSFKATTSFGLTQKFSVSLKVNSKGKAS